MKHQTQKEYQTQIFSHIHRYLKHSTIMKSVKRNSHTTMDPFCLPELLLKNAKSQLRISFSLYLRFKGPDSIFHLQQALELAGKSFVTASTNSINIKAFGHDICKVAPNVWKDIEKDWSEPSDPQKAEIIESLKSWIVNNGLDEKISNCKELQAIYALPLPKLLECYQSEIWKDNSQTRRTDKAKKLFGVEHSTEEIQQYLNDIKKAGKEFQNIRKILRHGASDSEILSFFDMLTRPEQTRSLTYQKVKEQERLKNYKKTFFKTNNDKKSYMYAIYVFRNIQTIPKMLIPLCILIQEHQQPCRYLDPDNPQETDPLTVYNRKHYLIKNYFVLYQHMRILSKQINQHTKCLKRLDETGTMKKLQRNRKKIRK